MKILIAEDESLLLNVMSHKFRKEGHEIIECPDGAEAMSKFSLHRPDLVITDMMMPFNNGLEVVDFIRNQMKSDIPIIMVTSMSSEQNITDAYEMGVDEYMTKPFSLSELYIRANRLLVSRTKDNAITNILKKALK
jgi:DNA-binding response OmpR family regulator